MDAPSNGRDPFDLTDRTAIVTGASSGIGRAITLKFARAGARVLALARRAELLESLAAEGDGIEPVPCDLASEAQVRDAVELARRGSKVSVLVNNAGVMARDDSRSEMNRTLDLNLSAAHQLTVLLADHFTSAASVINIASIYGLVAPGSLAPSAYAASKAGLVHLTRDLAVRYASRGVRINALAPGYFATEMTEGFLGTDAGARLVQRSTPMGRAGELDEIADVAHFFASDASSYVTGQVLAVDGGWTAR